MERMITTVEELKRLEAKAEKEYRRLLKKLKDPEYADLRALILRMAIDTAFHKHLMEALERAYHESLKLVDEYGTREDVGEIALIPGLPTMVMPLGFGAIGARVPPEEIIEEYLKDFPTEVVLPENGDGKLGELLGEYIKLQERMLELYDRLSRRAFHPVVRGLATEIKRNEEQHGAILKKLGERYGTHSAGA
ncbi:hypothetical protein [Thermococcus barossii]|uniref:Rubrerythrin family protein n=1 Tax=Thermococcus barossii TaxID=54077 RepID=A0A2Z2ME89_9EURY|nr:hypothetical protein [Thermococcus barossii]ASJ04176.1 hypothetical protein A3L01_01865 [Thermococcus barossii]